MKKGDKQLHLVIARVSLGMQQQELADRVNGELIDGGFTWNTLSKLENGWKKSITQEEALALCRILKISEEELTKGGIRVK